jgi:predicted acylesterase/phospholipase RssA
VTPLGGNGTGGPARVGIALAGGGPVGAVYEIGALRALEEAIEGLDLTDAHVYVGVSAGSVVAAALANRMSVAHLVHSVATRVDDDPFLPQVFFVPAYREWISRALQIPRLAGEAARSFVRRRSVLRALRHFAAAIPVAIFDNEPIRRSLHAAFSRPGRTDDFRQLAHRLIIVATDLGTAEPIRFGEQPWQHVPISTAIQASTALPGVYPSVWIDGRQCVDGVLLKTVHASAAFEAGCDIVLCVNPIVPVDTSRGTKSGLLPEGVLVRHGLPTLISQSLRTMIRSRLQAGFAAYEARFENADFLLFEPEHDLYQMFFSNIFSLSSRRAVCELAYRATRRDLARRAAEIAPALARHGLTLREDVLHDSTRTVWTGLDLDEEIATTGTQEFRIPMSTRVARRLEETLERIEEMADG